VSPRGLAGIVRRLAPSLAASGFSVEFERLAGGNRQRIIRLTFSGHDGPPAKVLALADDQEQTQATAEQIASIMVASGLTETWTATKAANLALHKSFGNAFLAARALNMLAVPAPDGGIWTAVKIQGVT
jgi:hypothetical protein